MVVGVYLDEKRCCAAAYDLPGTGMYEKPKIIGELIDIAQPSTELNNNIMTPCDQVLQRIAVGGIRALELETEQNADVISVMFNGRVNKDRTRLLESADLPHLVNRSFAHDLGQFVLQGHTKTSLVPRIVLGDAAEGLALTEAYNIRSQHRAAAHLVGINCGKAALRGSYVQLQRRGEPVVTKQKKLGNHVSPAWEARSVIKLAADLHQPSRGSDVRRLVLGGLDIDDHPEIVNYCARYIGMKPRELGGMIVKVSSFFGSKAGTLGAAALVQYLDRSTATTNS